MEQLFCLRVHVLAGGLLADLQSTVVFCRNFSNCIFSSRTQEQPDCADQSLGGAIRAQAPAVGPTEATRAPSEGSKPEALGVCHTLWDVISACHTGAGAMPATAEQRGPGGRVGTRGHSEVEGAGGGGETWERHGPQSPFCRTTPVPTAGPREGGCAGSPWTAAWQGSRVLVRDGAGVTSGQRAREEGALSAGPAGGWAGLSRAGWI